MTKSSSPSGKYDVAVIGATGNVGAALLEELANRNFPVDKIDAFATSDSLGRDVSFGDEKILSIKSIETIDLSNYDIAFCAAGGEVARKLAPQAKKTNCVMIDKSSAFRMEPGVPLVVPEINGDQIAGFENQYIIANPNCSTIQMVMALKPLHDIAPIKRVVVSTYQSVSGGGRKAMDELFNQTRGIYTNSTAEKRNFTKQIAFNVIPHIDAFMEDGSTKEEWKMMMETKKILDPNIEVVATCVRVPVFIGHACAINVEFHAPITVKQARAAFEEFEGLSVVDHRADEGYVTPVECAGEEAVYVSRLRSDKSVPHGLSFWCVADNLRKGAALNAVQIAEKLISNYL